MAPVQAVLFDYGMVLSAPPDPAAWLRMKDVTGLTEDLFHHGYWAHRHAYDRGEAAGTRDEPDWRPGPFGGSKVTAPRLATAKLPRAIRIASPTKALKNCRIPVMLLCRLALYWAALVTASSGSGAMSWLTAASEFAVPTPGAAMIETEFAPDGR